jgi:dTDP-glucose 4,6-dehydratase
MITNALQDKPLPVYGDGQQVRDWLYVTDHCEAILTVLKKGKIGEVYNIGGSNEWHNIDIVKNILKRLDKPESLIEHVTDRLGHDRRYAIDSAKIQQKLGWLPRHSPEEGLKKTIDWYVRKYGD